ncbi:MAG: hypothetical protein KKH88_01545 [Nanoarchaeota archaeon]|nr:hypothetical protein [Nanoarchaeota archaeon]
MIWLKKIGVLFLCLIFFVSIVYGYPSSWAPRIDLDANENANVVAWGQNSEGGLARTYFFKHSGTFSVPLLAPVQFSCGSMNQGPDMAVDINGDVHVTVYGYSSGYKMWYSKLNGETLTPIINCKLVESTPAHFPASLDYRDASVAADLGGNAHIVLAKSSKAYYYKINGTNGNFLVNDLQINNAGSVYSAPDLVLDSNDNVHIVWTQGQLVYTKIEGDGLNVGDPIIDDIIIDSDSDNEWASIALDNNGDVHVAWLQEGVAPNYNRVNYAKVGGTNGDILISPVPMDLDYSNIVWWGPPGIAVDGDGNAHVVSEKAPLTGGSVLNYHNYSWVDYLKINGNTGSILIPEFKIAPNNASIPSVDVDENGDAHIVWQKYIRNGDSFYYKSFYTKLNGDNGDLIFTDIPLGDGPIGEPACSDGTLFGQCTETRPYICQAGELVENCQVCGCPRNRACKPDGTCLASKVKKTAMPLFSAVQEGVQKDIITRIVYFFKGLF